MHNKQWIIGLFCIMGCAISACDDGSSSGIEQVCNKDCSGYVGGRTHVCILKNQQEMCAPSCLGKVADQNAAVCWHNSSLPNSIDKSVVDTCVKDDLGTLYAIDSAYTDCPYGCDKGECKNVGPGPELQCNSVGGRSETAFTINGTAVCKAACLGKSEGENKACWRNAPLGSSAIDNAVVDTCAKDDNGNLYSVEARYTECSDGCDKGECKKVGPGPELQCNSVGGRPEAAFTINGTAVCKTTCLGDAVGANKVCWRNDSLSNPSDQATVDICAKDDKGNLYSVEANYTDCLDGCEKGYCKVDCKNVDSQYQNAVQNEGELLSNDELKAGMANGSVKYPMAVSLNESGINKLLRSATDWDYSYAIGEGTTITLGFPTIHLDGCPVDMLSTLQTELQADANYYNLYYAPQIRANNEISCITMEMPFELHGVLSQGTITASVNLPVYTTTKGNDPGKPEEYAKGVRTVLFVDLKHAHILSFNSSVSMIESLLNTAWKYLVSNQFKNFALFDIGAWAVGNKNIKLIAGVPTIKADSRTIQFGVYSNLVWAKNSATTIDDALPDNADIGLNIHPNLIRGILARMMRETKETSDDTYIATTLEDAEAGLNYKFTMVDWNEEYPQEQLLNYDWYKQNQANWGKYFSFAFRLWSNSSPCGYTDLISGLNAEIGASKKISIIIGNMNAGKSNGGPVMNATIMNMLTNTQFFRDILSYTAISFNFNEIGVPSRKDDEDGSSMVNAQMETISLTVDGNGISMFNKFSDSLGE